VTVSEPLSAGPRLGDDRALRAGLRAVLALLCLSGPALAAGPEAATSDSARVAPGPSERTAPAAPDVRQAPPGGGNDARPDATTPDDTRPNDTRAGNARPGNARAGRASGGKSHD